MMYAKINTESPMDDCFAEKAKIWIWYGVFFMLASTGAGFAVEKLVKVKQMYNTPVKQVRLVAMQSQQPFYNTIIQAYKKNYSPYYSQNQRYIQQGIPGNSAGVYPVGLVPVNLVKPAVFKQFDMEVSPAEGFPGVCVHSVYRGGYAQRAGLIRGDIIVKFNGRNIRSINTLRKTVAMAVPESDAQIHFIRNGRKLKSVIRVGRVRMMGTTIPAAYQPRLWCQRR